MNKDQWLNLFHEAMNQIPRTYLTGTPYVDTYHLLAAFEHWKRDREAELGGLGSL